MYKFLKKQIFGYLFLFCQYLSWIVKQLCNFIVSFAPFFFNENIKRYFVLFFVNNAYFILIFFHYFVQLIYIFPITIFYIIIFHFWTMFLHSKQQVLRPVLNGYFIWLGCQKVVFNELETNINGVTASYNHSVF